MKTKDLWYDKYWLEKETPKFNTWFEDYYGQLEDYDNTQINREEYYLRKGFSLMGWLGKGGELE